MIPGVIRQEKWSVPSDLAEVRPRKQTLVGVSRRERDEILRLRQERAHLSQEALAFLAVAGLRPALAAYFAQCREHVAASEWDLGICPSCGARSSNGLDMNRILRGERGGVQRWSRGPDPEHCKRCDRESSGGNGGPVFLPPSGVNREWSKSHPPGKRFPGFRRSAHKFRRYRT